MGFSVYDGNAVYQCSAQDKHRFWRNQREHDNVFHLNEWASETSFDSEADYYFIEDNWMLNTITVKLNHGILDNSEVKVKNYNELIKIHWIAEYLEVAPNETELNVLKTDIDSEYILILNDKTNNIKFKIGSIEGHLTNAFYKLTQI